MDTRPKYFISQKFKIQENLAQKESKRGICTKELEDIIRGLHMEIKDQGLRFILSKNLNRNMVR